MAGWLGPNCVQQMPRKLHWTKEIWGRREIDSSISEQCHDRGYENVQSMIIITSKVYKGIVIQNHCHG